MITLYLDNFRGFSKTFMPLKMVNFLVGENSSGKTSILALLGLISSFDYWQTLDFNSPNYEFGGFKDIISVSSEKDSFSFGLSEERMDKATGKKNHYSYLLMFKEKESLPFLYYFSFLANNKLVSMRAEEETYSYCIKELDIDTSTTDTSSLFRMLEEPLTLDKSYYKTTGRKTPARIGLWTLFYWLESPPSDQLSPMFELFLEVGARLSHMAWFAPIRTRPKRTYDGYGRTFSPEGEHTPYLIRKYFASKEKAMKFSNALKYFGDHSGLFRKIIIKNFGRDATAPFELKVILSKDALRLNSVGYGVSQVLPLVVEMILRGKGSWYAIQQPEVHLHPRAQAALGDLIYQMSERENKRFLIETHSDFTINSFRINLKKNINHKTDAQVLYFERSKKGNIIYQVPILENGAYSENQPKHFRDFFIKEQLELLSL